MIKSWEVIPTKTYANRINAEKAVAKMLERDSHLEQCNLRYSIIWDQEGRCFPVFFGISALEAGVAHLGFNVIAFS